MEQPRQLLYWHYNAESMRQAAFAYVVLRFHVGDTPDERGALWHHVHQPIVVGWRGDRSEANRHARNHLFEFIEFDEEEHEEAREAENVGEADENDEVVVVEGRSQIGAETSLPLRPSLVTARRPRDPLRRVS